MSDPQRARSDPSGAWDRARRAYVEMLDDQDPAGPMIAAGASDRRLGFVPPLDEHRPVVVSGPDDLQELRELVESALGVGTWPAPGNPGGRSITARVELSRPTAALGLIMAMEGLIEARSPWGRWRTVVDTLAARVNALDAVTVDLRVLESVD